MGCGQSKILIYHRKSKTEKSSKNNYAKDDSDASDSHPEAEATGSTEGGSDHTEAELHEMSVADNSTNLLENSDVSHSQLDFFKMLDEKIENGADYEEDDLEREQERLRLRRLLQDWLRKPQVDTQRFPTAYQPCPPARMPHRVCPRPPIYPQARAYMFSRTASVETGEMQYHDPYMETRREEAYAYGSMGFPPPPEQFSIPPEVSYGYNRVAYDAPDLYGRNRVMLSSKPAGPGGGRAMSFDVNAYGRVEPRGEDFYPASNEYMQRPREIHYQPHPIHLSQYQPAAPVAVQYGIGPDEPIQYMVRPAPPREMAPLQGSPGPPHGSPRPLAVRLPTGAAWRRPRGPVTELA